MNASTIPRSQIGRVAVAVVEDDLHFSLFLESMLEASPRHRLVAVAGTAAEAMAWGESVQPHVVLLDVGLPDRAGSALVADLLARYPRALIIMLSAEAGEATILESIQGGATGYVLKGAREEEILAAIDDALAGGAPMSPAIARRVIGLIRQPAARTVSAVPGQMAILTARELEILESVADGASDKEVAERLGISRSTVKNALLVIYQKWRVRSRTEAAVVFTRLKESRA